MNDNLSNIQEIKDFIDVLDMDLSVSRKKVETPCGEQKTSAGYRIKSINLFENGANIEVYLCDRALKEKDEVRGEDLVQFVVRYDKLNRRYIVQTQEEYQKECEEKEKTLDMIWINGMLAAKDNSGAHQDFYQVKGFDEETDMVTFDALRMVKAKTAHLHLFSADIKMLLGYFTDIARPMTKEEAVLIKQSKRLDVDRDI